MWRNGGIKFVAGKNGINSKPAQPLRFVHQETHMEWPRCELGIPIVGGKSLTACATRAALDIQYVKYCRKVLDRVLKIYARRMIFKIGPHYKNHNSKSKRDASMKLCSMYSYYRRNACAENEQSKWKILKVRNFNLRPPPLTKLIPDESKMVMFRREMWNFDTYIGHNDPISIVGDSLLWKNAGIETFLLCFQNTSFLSSPNLQAGGPPIIVCFRLFKSGGVSSIRNLRTRHAVVTRNSLLSSPRNCQNIS